MARQFGTTTYVQVPDRASLAPDSVANSFACWVYIDSFNGSGDAYISEIFGDYDGADYSLQFRIGAGTQGSPTQKRIGLASGVGGNSGTGETWSLTDLSTGVWTHIGAASESGNVHFYLNGVLDYSGGAGLTFSDQSNTWLVGQLAGFGRPLNGRLAELGYWSGVTLGADDFKAMAKGAPPSLIRPAVLDLYLPFDDRGDSSYTTREWCGGSATLGDGAGSYVPSWGEHPPVLRRRRARTVLIQPGGTSYTLAAGTGSYTVTGGAASLRRGRNLTADAGSYTVTGGAATLRVSRRLTAGAGSYTVTGGAAAILAGRKLTAGAGSYTATGQAATIRRGRALAAAAGSYTVAGGAAALKAGRRLVAAAGAYSVAGSAASLTVAVNTVAPGGTFRRPLWSWARVFDRVRPSWDRVWRWTVPTNTLTPVELVKTVSDDREYAFDFSKAPELASGTGLTISSGAVSGGSGLSFGSVSVLAAAFDGIPSGKGVSVRIYGGSDDSTYEFAATVTLSNGRVLTIPCRLAVAADYE